MQKCVLEIFTVVKIAASTYQKLQDIKTKVRYYTPQNIAQQQLKKVVKM